MIFRRFSQCVVSLVAMLSIGACATTHQTSLTFPPSSELFLTSGDGDIQKPYTPVGHMIVSKRGTRIGFLPLFGLISFDDVDPEMVLRNEVFEKVREMGGDGLINMQTMYTPPKDGFLGFGANGGLLVVTGTVIKR